jgi:hypothetical protein
VHLTGFTLLINQWANVVLGNENEIVLRTAEFFMARRAYCSCHKSRGCGRVRK